MKLLMLVIILMASCTKTPPSGKSEKSERPQRYEVSLRDPPMVAIDAVAIAGNHAQWPSLVYLRKNGEIFKDDHIRAFKEDSREKREQSLGLGPSFIFNKADEKEEKSQHWFTKQSMQLTYQSGQIMRDYNDLAKKGPSDTVAIDDIRDLMECRLSATSEFACYVPDSNNDNAKTPEKILWQDEQNPIVEISTTSYPGVYFFSQDGSLWYFNRERTEVSDLARANAGMRFLKNHHGRYFIQSRRNEVCLQRDNLAIYCYEHNELGSFVGDGSEGGPDLKKIIDLDFKVDEVAYSGHHACFLAESGELFCKGSNTCGQITGRHDQEQNLPSQKKWIFWRVPLRKFLPMPVEHARSYAMDACSALDSELQ